MHDRTLAAAPPAAPPAALSFFRFGNVGGRVILTNDGGEWHSMPPADFDRLMRGELPPDDPHWRVLGEKSFLSDPESLDRLAARLRVRKDFLGQGPHLHIVLTTLRCNQSCRYCHASRTSMDRVDTDMTMETAGHVVDFILRSTSPYINIEFQGGEPTVNFPVLKYIVESSREKNAALGKRLEHSMVSNFTWMTEEIAEWIVENKVQVCTSLDGPEDLHNWNRTWTGGNAWADVMRWMRTINRRHIELGRDPRIWHVDALMTTTRRTMERWREVIDLYVELGIRNIHLRPLNPYGFALGSWKTIGYGVDEYLEFYERALGYIIELNRQGVEVMEATAALFLVKMLTPNDPNYVDIRSPTGAGTGVLAYNYDGGIFPSDEARMLSAMGNDLFRLGRAGEVTYEQVVAHPTVRALALASLQDALPACATCWNKPFCGIDPIDNYMVHGDIFGQRPLSPNCREYYHIASLLMRHLNDDRTGEIERIFRRWTIGRARDDD